MKLIYPVFGRLPVLYWVLIHNVNSFDLTYFVKKYLLQSTMLHHLLPISALIKGHVLKGHDLSLGVV